MIKRIVETVNPKYVLLLTWLLFLGLGTLASLQGKPPSRGVQAIFAIAIAISVGLWYTSYLMQQLRKPKKAYGLSFVVALATALVLMSAVNRVLQVVGSFLLFGVWVFPVIERLIKEQAAPGNNHQTIGY